ncbi:MAG: C45 family autoproteolytic acyltransferase/hydrolase [Negativicutes bacterium]|nr:C45 family autoproteolytic acyltransferase/hydrolase [Negativicutes bacterium]
MATGKIGRLLIVAAFALAALTGPVAGRPDAGGDRPVLIAGYDGGQLYATGDYRLVILSGSYHRMGVQYGHLQADAIRDIYRRLIAGLVGDDCRYGEFRRTADYIWRGYPLRYRDFLRGVAEGSGLDLTAVLMVNNLEAFDSPIYGSGCSFLAVTGRYTAGHRLIWGRNFDGTGNRFARWLEVRVLRPADGSLATASIGICGAFFTTTGFNSAGVWLALNNAGPGSGGGQRLFAPVTLLTALENSPEFSDLAMWLDTVRPDVPFNYLIDAGDGHQAASFEWHADRTVRRDIDADLLAATNHYLSSSWPQPVGMEGVESGRRYQNLCRLAGDRQGQITPAAMCDIMSVPLAEGGTLFPAADGTAWQVVADPAAQTIWLRSPLVGERWAVVKLADWW